MTIPWKPLSAMKIGVGLIAAAAWARPAPRLLWNASASAPMGLYAVHPETTPKLADLVVVAPPLPLARFLNRRGYLPKSVPLLKHIAAVRGAVVCRHGDLVTVDRAPVAVALDHDRLGRTLPNWQGCLPLAAGQVFLLNRDIPDSFDGRYFGPIDASRILGRASPIWVRPGR